LKHKYLSESYQQNTIALEYGSTSEEDFIAKELGIFIDAVVERMPAQRKQIYMLSRNEGLSNAEIAARLDTTKRNVESQLSLALKEIRKAISLFLLLFF
jgi:RNA polymerase sigma-70 factor (ECF subfamily)